MKWDGRILTYSVYFRENADIFEDIIEVDSEGMHNSILSYTELEINNHSEVIDEAIIEEEIIEEPIDTQDVLNPKTTRRELNDAINRAIIEFMKNNYKEHDRKDKKIASLLPSPSGRSLESVVFVVVAATVGGIPAPRI